MLLIKLRTMMRMKLLRLLFGEELVFRWQECNFIILVILMFGMYWIYLMQSKTE